MAQSGTKIKEISLGDDFGAVIINVNHARIGVAENGHVIAKSAGGIEVRTAANDSANATAVNPAELKPGERMPDGTIYAGISPDSQKPMYTTPEDAPLTYTFNEARNTPRSSTLEVTMTGVCRRVRSSMWCSTTVLRSAGLTKAVLLPPVGTGRPRRTTSAMRGLSASATGPWVRTSRATTRLSVCAGV